MSFRPTNAPTPPKPLNVVLSVGVQSGWPTNEFHIRFLQTGSYSRMFEAFKEEFGGRIVGGIEIPYGLMYYGNDDKPDEEKIRPYDTPFVKALMNQYDMSKAEYKEPREGEPFRIGDERGTYITLWFTPKAS